VLEAVAGLGEHGADEPRGEERVTDRLSPRQRLVLEAVPAARAAGVDSIARVAGMSAVDVSAALEELHVGDLVVPDGRGWRLARRPRADASSH
jgi:DNA processing protein